MDKKVAREGFDKVLRSDLLKQRGDESDEMTVPRVFSSSQSISISRIQRADGSVEETKVVRSSDGREERTTTIYNTKNGSATIKGDEETRKREDEEASFFL